MDATNKFSKHRFWNVYDIAGFEINIGSLTLSYILDGNFYPLFGTVYHPIDIGCIGVSERLESASERYGLDNVHSILIAEGPRFANLSKDIDLFGLEFFDEN